MGFPRPPHTFVYVIQIRHSKNWGFNVDKRRCLSAESRLHAQEDIRGPLSELQVQVLPEIQDQIQDYRYTHEQSWTVCLNNAKSASLLSVLCFCGFRLSLLK